MGSLRWIDPVEPVKLRVAIGEDPTVGGNEPVTTTVGGRRHADDRLVERHPARRTEELCVATKAEDPAVRGDLPVARRRSAGRLRLGKRG